MTERLQKVLLSSSLKKPSEDQWNRFYRNIYSFSVTLYSYAEELIADPKAGKSIKVVRQKDLVANPDQIISEIAQFCNLDIDSKSFDFSPEKSPYKRPHKNKTLEHFGLSRQDIENDLGDIINKYNL
jgi:hypothetical protein